MSDTEKEEMLESLNDLYHDVLFMVEAGDIVNVMGDIIYKRAEKILRDNGKLT